MSQASERASCTCIHPYMIHSAPSQQKRRKKYCILIWYHSFSWKSLPWTRNNVRREFRLAKYIITREFNWDWRRKTSRFEDQSHRRVLLRRKKLRCFLLHVVSVEKERKSFVRRLINLTIYWVIFGGEVFLAFMTQGTWWKLIKCKWLFLDYSIDGLLN